MNMLVVAVIGSPKAGGAADQQVNHVDARSGLRP